MKCSKQTEVEDINSTNQKCVTLGVQLHVLLWEQLVYELAMCACSPEIHLYPGLKKMKHGQQVEGGDSIPLLCSCETPSGGLHPALVLSSKKSRDLLKQAQRRDMKIIRGVEPPVKAGLQSWGF